MTSLSFDKIQIGSGLKEFTRAIRIELGLRVRQVTRARDPAGWLWRSMPRGFPWQRQSPGPFVWPGRSPEAASLGRISSRLLRRVARSAAGGGSGFTAKGGFRDGREKETFRSRQEGLADPTTEGQVIGRSSAFWPGAEGKMAAGWPHLRNGDERRISLSWAPTTVATPTTGTRQSDKLDHHSPPNA